MPGTTAKDSIGNQTRDRVQDEVLNSACTRELVLRLHRIEGQVRGVTRMVETGQSCSDVLIQLSAVISAARCVGLLVLQEHVRQTLLEECHEPETVLGEINEAMESFTRVAC